MSRIRANQITNQSADGAPTVQNGLVISGVTTSTNVSVASSVTATTYYGSGANLTNITSTTINNNANNRLITGSGTANTLEGEANLTFDGDSLLLLSSTDGRRVSFAGGGTSHYMKFDNTLNGIILNGYGGITFETNGTNERLRIDSSGRVMIGNTNASTMFGGADDLVVGNTSGAHGITIITSDSTVGRLLFSDSTSSAPAIYQGQVNYNHSTDTLDLRTYTGGSITLSTSNTERVTIKSDGKIGINIADNTAADLQVRTGTNGAGVFRLGGSSSNAIGMDMTYSNSGATSTIFKQNYLSTNAGALMQFDSGYITFRTGTSPTERMKINSNGQVTKPYQPMLSMTVNSSIQSGNYLIHSSVITNNGSHYNTGNGRFTCPVAGFYYASIMIMSNNSNTTMDFELHKNSNNFNNILVPYQANTGGAYNQVSGSCIIQCSANDILQFKLNSGSVYDGRHSNITFCLLA